MTTEEWLVEQGRKVVADWSPPTEEVNRALTTLAIQHATEERDKEREQAS